MRRMVLILLAGAWCAGAWAAPKSPAAKMWQNIDARHRAYGKEITADAVQSFVVLTAVFRVEDLKKKKVNFADIGQAVPYAVGKRFMAIGSVRNGRLNEGKVEQLCEKNKMDPPEFPVFNGAAVTNEPEVVNYPFYYVVDWKGGIAYKGTSLMDAGSAAVKALGAIPREDLHFGLEKVDKCAAVTNMVEEGVNTRLAYQYLRKEAMGRDPEKSEEAVRLMVALDQKRDLRVDTLKQGFYDSPGMTMFKIKELVKMWPELKTDKRVTALEEQVKEEPDVAKMVKIVADAEKIMAQKVKRKSDAKKLAQQMVMAERRIQKMEKSKNGGVQAEAASYAIKMREFVERMEAWEPPPPEEKAAPAKDAEAGK